ncbi:MAG: hypothetical protein Mars2KO_23570 [Maribacter sp.]
MTIAQLAKILILTHAGFGGIALISGAISLLAKKGTVLHKKSGKLFFYTMLTSTILSLAIANMPNHKSSFLFCIGIFSSYFIIGGFRSLNYRKRNHSVRADKFLAYLIIVTGAAMMIYPVLLDKKIDIVLFVFGLIALIFGVIDLILLKNLKKLKKNWLKIHLSKMISGYVAAVTAFVVVNEWIPGVWAWFTPSIFGTVYLAYWFFKLQKKGSVTKPT